MNTMNTINMIDTMNIIDDIHPIKIIVTTNTSNPPMTLTKSSLSNIDKSIMSSLHKYPFLYTKDTYSKHLLETKPYEEIVQIFFIKEKMLAMVNTLSEHDKAPNDILSYNLGVMISLLFPISFPELHNNRTSFNELLQHRPDSAIITQLKDRKYSYLRLQDGKQYTVTKTLILDDVFNHALYRKLFFENYKQFTFWYNDMKIKLPHKIDRIKKKISSFANSAQMAGIKVAIIDELEGMNVNSRYNRIIMERVFKEIKQLLSTQSNLTDTQKQIINKFLKENADTRITQNVVDDFKRVLENSDVNETLKEQLIKLFKADLQSENGLQTLIKNVVKIFNGDFIDVDDKEIPIRTSILYDLEKLLSTQKTFLTTHKEALKSLYEQMKLYDILLRIQSNLFDDTLNIHIIDTKDINTFMKKEMPQYLNFIELIRKFPKSSSNQYLQEIFDHFTGKLTPGDNVTNKTKTTSDEDEDNATEDVDAATKRDEKSVNENEFKETDEETPSFLTLSRFIVNHNQTTLPPEMYMKYLRVGVLKSNHLSKKTTSVDNFVVYEANVFMTVIGGILDDAMVNKWNCYFKNINLGLMLQSYLKKTDNYITHDKIQYIYFDTEDMKQLGEQELNNKALKSFGGTKKRFRGRQLHKNFLSQTAFVVSRSPTFRDHSATQHRKFTKRKILTRIPADISRSLTF